MATLTLEIADNKMQRIVEALKEGGHEQAEDENNRQFLKRVIKEYFREHLFTHDIRQANRSVTRDDDILT